MNILLVSECSKNALTETRRILDHFAERRGERTWQTSITLDGLNALRKLLRKTARKNTAVACHWIRGKDHSELLWIVGDAHRFNAEGAVPTNFTQQDILRNGDENDWHTGEDIRLIAQLAALIHDLGKASTAFQDRLRRFLNGQQTQKNLYRHEWVSLRLFQAFVGDDDDEVWLTRLADENSNYEALWTTAGRYMRDGLDAKNEDRYPFRKLASQAPLAAAIAWLVVTHHRLPAKPVIDDGTRKQKRIGSEVKSLALTEIPAPLTKVAHDWNEVIQDVTPAQVRPYWDMSKDIPLASPLWKKQAAKVAKQLLARHNRRRENWLDNPYVMHLARLCLMLADHHYSSLGLTKRTNLLLNG